MAKKKAPIKKKDFGGLAAFKKDNGFKNTVKDKELEWIPFNESWHEALGIPGIPKGYLTLVRGYSNTGKSTSAYEAAASCQKRGIIPVIIDTENNWDWDHAKNIGLEFEPVADEYGEIIDYEGHFIFIDNDALLDRYGTFDHDEGKHKKESRSEAVVEDVSMLIDDLLELQANGQLPYELCFIWDSIGSLNCMRCVKSKTKNNMWNAGALETAFKAILNHKIPASKKEGKPYTNTMLGVQKIWFDSMSGAGAVKHKGGEAFFYAARLIIHLGGVQSHGTTKLTATSGGRGYGFGIATKVKGIKNQVNGIEWEGKIASTSHGFINPDKKNDYTKEHKNYLLGKLNLEYGDIVIEEAEPSDEDIREMLTGE